MSDFNQFDPNINKGVHFGLNKQGQKETPAEAEETEAPQATDPYADQKLDPSKVMAFLSLQGQQAGTGQVSHLPVIESIQAFSALFSPEHHNRLLEQFLAVVRQEAPGLSQPAQANLAQNALDDYIIGQPVVSA